METVFQPGSSSPRRNLLDGTADSDLLDQLLAGDEWFEIPDCSDTLQSNTLNPLSPFSSLSFSPLFEVSDGKFNPNPSEAGTQVEKEVADDFMNSFLCETSVVDRGAKGKQYISSDMNMKSPSQELTKNWCIRPGDPNFPVLKRFEQALAYIKESHKDYDVLIQIWVPVKRGDNLILTTYDQPFALNHNSMELVSYREVSESYQFSAEKDSNEALGLPGRVYLGRLPEWTPDVRCFNINEYPRVFYAQRFGVRGTIALPVFERFGCNCLGVIEVVMTKHKITYSFELENICHALQAVELRSSGVLTIPRMKVSSDSYQATLYEILGVLKGVCKLHMLPLAQTWVPCLQHGKQGTRHSDDNYRTCISTADEACYVYDPSVLAFHEACSEHHLLRGQGLAGKAFTTNQPCYLPDITSSCKTEYPLSHHARMFSLKGAVAIRLRSTQTGTTDFVLEFFLPTSCTEIKDQKLTLDSLSSSIQKFSQTLRVITVKELDDEAISEVNEWARPEELLKTPNSKRRRRLNYNETSGEKHTEVDLKVANLVTSSLVTPEKELSSNAELKATEELVMETQRNKSKKIMTAENIFSNFEKPRHDLFVDSVENMDSFSDVGGAHGTAKEIERRRSKTEKTISLQVLRKYFSGSLKDAAKSIGVCPTTLKRICRQHGISRWPSRKIKKVDHSLKKLQVVIDSVHGADKVINLISLYKDFNMTPGSDNNSSAVVTPSLPENYNNLKSAEKLEEDTLANHPSSSSQSASKCSQMFSSGFSSSSGEKKCLDTELLVKQEFMEEKLNYFHQGIIGRQESIVSQEMAQKCVISSQTRTSNGNSSSLDNNTSKWIAVKAMYGSEKVRLRLNPSWSFHDLKQEILTRFNLSVTSSMNLKYIDDDSEWVLLTCDADLGECLHVYRSTSAKTIRVLVEPSASAHTRGSLGAIG